MSKFWREEADPKKHLDFISTHNQCGIPIEASKDNLIKKWVYFAEVNNFVFQFANLAQIKECIAYFSKKTHPSTRTENITLEHYWHPWYSKLPKSLNNAKNVSRIHA